MFRRRLSSVNPLSRLISACASPARATLRPNTCMALVFRRDNSPSLSADASVRGSQNVPDLGVLTHTRRSNRYRYRRRREVNGATLLISTEAPSTHPNHPAICNLCPKSITSGLSPTCTPWLCSQHHGARTWAIRLCGRRRLRSPHRTTLTVLLSHSEGRESLRGFCGHAFAVPDSDLRGSLALQGGVEALKYGADAGASTTLFRIAMAPSRPSAGTTANISAM